MAPTGRARRLGVALAALGAGSLVLPAGAGAAERVIAGPAPSDYLNPQVRIDQGEALSFLNVDATAPHDVTSVEPGLFGSKTVLAGTETPVTGADSLGPGEYPFICSIHPGMEGTLAVGGGGAGGRDRTAPRLSLRVLDKRIAAVLGADKLSLRAKLDEPATLRVRATAGRREVKVAKAKAKLGTGTSRLAARLTSAGRRLLSGADRVKLELAISAEDSAGNAGKQKTTATLR